MFLMANKELLTSNLNRITASAICVSSMIVFLSAKLALLIVAHANKKDGVKPISPKRVPFFAS